MRSTVGVQLVSSLAAAGTKSQVSGLENPMDLSGFESGFGL